MSFGKNNKVWENNTYVIPVNYELDIQTLKFVNKSNNPDPVFTDEQDSGFDLRAWITEEDEGSKLKDDVYEITLKPMERKLFHTGLYFELPKYTEIQVRPRSGISIKYGITVINTPATVDEGYTGECCVLLVNLSKEKFVIHNGDRIAQGVLCPVYNGALVNLIKVSEITSKTKRGDKGVGHSGIE